MKFPCVDDVFKLNSFRFAIEFVLLLELRNEQVGTRRFC
jgi:hypothetical protein